ncbi:MAG: GspH/FimT family pseudopilin [Methylococcales bacterium]|nr:GspH/FimT family pseudopilin [Methylococcales bacterium]
MDIFNKKIDGQQGFTLIELLITITIMSIVMSIGYPSFTGAVRNSRLTTNANQLIASLNLARSEAIKRNMMVYIRRKGTTSKNWSEGWDIFIDANNNQIFNEGVDTLLKTYPPLENNYTLMTGANFNDWTAYLPSGLNSSSGSFLNDSFRLCATAGDTINSRRVVLNAVGRARISRGDVSSCP